MDSLAWVVALVMMLAGAGYVLVKQREKDSRQALMAQKQNEKLARQEFHALNSKKAKGKTKKKVDVTADLKKKSQNFALQDDDQDHPSLITVLRGHKYGVTAAAYSPNGRFVATASSDRSIRLYFRDTLKDKNPKLHNIKIDYDHVTAMNFSSDGRSFVVATESGNIKVYQKLRVKPQIVTEFPISHKADVHSVLMNDIGNWATVITCAGDSDTDVKFWNLNGELLQVVNTNQVTNYHCVGSKDNRYIAVAAYTPEVKIYEIVRERTGAFKKVQKIMTLHGHRTGVVDLAFNGSDTLPVDRVVTISKDASLRVWDINGTMSDFATVRYTVQEDPKVLSSFNVSEGEAFQATDFAPNGKMLVMVRGKDLVFIRISDNKVFSTIKNAIEDLIKRATFSPDGSEVLVLGKNCKHVKIYKTPEL